MDSREKQLEDATRDLFLQAEEAQRKLDKLAEEADKALQAQISPYWENWGKDTQ